MHTLHFVSYVITSWLLRLATTRKKDEAGGETMTLVTAQWKAPPRALLLCTLEQERWQHNQRVVRGLIVRERIKCFGSAWISGTMTTLRRFTMDDLLKFNNINLDVLTETYNMPFYMLYMSRWPESFTGTRLFPDNVLLSPITLLTVFSGRSFRWQSNGLHARKSRRWRETLAWACISSDSGSTISPTWTSKGRL